mgnify:CR=1 FL=1
MYITKASHFVPEAVLTNEMFESYLKTSDEWIVKRTGIRQRRTATLECSSRPMRYMAEESVKKLCLTDTERSEIKHIVFASGLAEENYPNIGNYIAQTFSIKAPGIRVNSACSSLISGMKFSKSLTDDGDVLLVCSESFTSIGDYSDKSSCVLLGDGACAFLLSSTAGEYHIGNIELSGFGSNIINTGAPGERPKTTILDFCAKVYPSLSREMFSSFEHFPSYGSFSQNGKEVYKTILTDIPLLLKEKLARLSMNPSDTYFIGHQANLRMLEKIAERTGFAKEKHLHNVSKYGNTGSAGCGIVLSEHIEKETMQKDEKLVLSAFGAGIVYGTAIITKT